MALLFRFCRGNLVNIIFYFFNCLTLFYLSKLPSLAFSIFPWIVTMLFLANLMISFIFNKSKLFFITLILIFSYLILLLPNYENMFQYHILVAFSLVIPLNIILASKFKERGINSRNGKFKLSCFTVEFLFLFYLLIIKESLFSSINDITLFPRFLESFVVVNHMVSFIFFLSLLYLFISDLLRPNLIKNISLFIISVLYLALMAFDNIPWIHVSFITCNLFIFIALLRKSYKMAYHDDLTGVPARRALNEDMDKLSGMYAIAMIDIDFFKQFNDNYGHDVGDEALRFVAKTIEKQVEHGRFYRFGGEEFTILYPKLSKEEVMINLENIRRSIDKNGFKSHSLKSKNKEDKILKLTISIGVADHKNNELRSYEVLKNADSALYEAKKAGRNMIKRNSM